jgi:glucoamylase
VGTALSQASDVWFTLSHGILNEIYYPRIDQAAVRDMGLIVTDELNFFSEEKKATHSTINWMAEGVPAFRLINTCKSSRYRIEKQIVTDPHRNAILQQIHFVPLQGAISTYRLYALLSPHLDNHGEGNTAWIGELDGHRLLFAYRNGKTLALASSAPWMKRSVGYVGSSDGWQDLKANGKMTWEYTKAENGNVALTGEIDLAACHGKFVLAIGFGKDANEAAQSAIASLHDGFDKARQDYIAGWQSWIATHLAVNKTELAKGDLSRISLAVLRTHESKLSPGGLIASLSVPWGSSMGDNDQGGYHLVWSRDMVETAGALLAGGAHEDARRVLSFLQRTQQPDGHWSQNMWVDGTAYWNGIQLDETALPILLVDLAYREKALRTEDLARFWPMVKSAAGYLARNGPVSPQDRWEEDPGYSPFTVAAEIAALLAAADLADLHHEQSLGSYLREIADVWNCSVERWIYISGTAWCRKYDVRGYYERIDPVDTGTGLSRLQSNVKVKNVGSAEDTMLARHLVSPDALALVRFGLRAADDQRICDTIKVIDALLKVETPSGASWHRYNDDGYGEHPDGSPFDGTGVGRAWPLLTGERAHYELLAGRPDSARNLLTALERFANEGGLIPEQIWDTADIPHRELSFGKPSGSAMPLVWAHAEYIKLRRSLRDGRVFDLPPQTHRRYVIDKTMSPRFVWRFNHKIRLMSPGKSLRIETLAAAVVRWTDDEWKTSHDGKSHEAFLGLHLFDLATESLTDGRQIQFTFYWPKPGNWENKNFVVRIGSN